MTSALPRVALVALLSIAVGCATGGGDETDPTPTEDTGGTGDGTSGDETTPAGDGATTDGTAGETTVTPTDTSVTTSDTSTMGMDTSVATDTSMATDTATSETCATSCSLSTKSCDGNAVRTCVQAGACTEWSAAVACPGGTTCGGGVCAATCTNACTLNDRQCSGNSAQVCQTQASGCTDWSTPTPCDALKVCSGGVCSATCTDQCTEGAKKCAAGTADATQICATQVSGCKDWSPAVACAGGLSCTAGNCVPCTNGNSRCGATGNIETCTTGAWLETSACSFGCTAGACDTSVSCTAGTYRCNGKAVEICNASGTSWLYSATCNVDCAGGLCTGACTPGAKRCNAGKSETCNAGGTAWESPETCTSFCDDQTGKCALAELTIDSSTTKSFDGEIVVAGAVLVKNGGTLKSDTGNLTIRAGSITVETGANVDITPSGIVSNGGEGWYQGSGCYCYHGGGGGTYAAGGATDATVGPGSAGGPGYNGAPLGGKGGGVLRLIADTINIAGAVSAKGAIGTNQTSGQYSSGGGGSGGGILVAANSLTMSGVITVDGGAGGTGPSSANNGSPGGLGRVKLLYGAVKSITGTVTGQRTDGLLPPLRITSATHPDPNLIYNDDFGNIALTWNKSFQSVQAYYLHLDKLASKVPTATSFYEMNELYSFPRPLTPSVLPDNAQTTFYFHIAPINAQSLAGTVENTFRIQINTAPPVVTCPSGHTQTAWSTNRNPNFQWTHTVADSNYNGYYWVFDHNGRTVPTTSDPLISIAQKNMIRPNVTDGVWAFHVVAVDKRGYLTKKAGHYRVRIGADPLFGSINGTVTAMGGDAGGSMPVSGATVTVNDGLFNFVGEAPDATTLSTGSYSFPKFIPVGTWNVTVSAPGYKTKTQTVNVTLDAASTSNFTLEK